MPDKASSSAPVLPVVTPEIQAMLDAAKADGRAEASQEHAEQLKREAREQEKTALLARVADLEDRLDKYAEASALTSDAVADVKKGELSTGSKYKIAGYSVVGGGGSLYLLNELVGLLGKLFGG